MSSLKTQWRVQVRRSRTHKWENKGLFETRDAARVSAYRFRVGRWGFGNTRVQRYVKGSK